MRTVDGRIDRQAESLDLAVSTSRQALSALHRAARDAEGAASQTGLEDEERRAVLADAGARFWALEQQAQQIVAELGRASADVHGRG